MEDSSGQVVSQAGGVTILGVDERFWHAGQEPKAADSASTDQVIVNQALADKLGIQAGASVTLHLQQVSAVPRESLLGKRDADQVIDTLTLRVGAVIPNEGLGGFNLVPSPEPPRNAFVPLRKLQKELNQARRVNALLVGDGTEALSEKLRHHLTLEDWGLVLHRPKDRARKSHPYLSLESRQLLLEPAVEQAALAAAKEASLRAAPTLVYLAIGISDGTHEIPYSVVAALDPTLAPPLGPFLPPGVDRLADDEIVLVDWDESPLRVQPGGKITITYFDPNNPEKEDWKPLLATFTFRGKIPLEGPADDPNLTPEFPGITDKLRIGEWNPPFRYDNKRIQKRDERYWDRYRTTPKAYITLAAGQRLWSNRFGRLTSIRLAPPSGASPSPDWKRLADDFERRLLNHLQPEQGGLVFDDVRQRSLEASIGTTDFGGYFLGFSCFLIASALLLVGLLFRLNLDRRGSEIGVLLAAGYRRGLVRRLLLAEGSILAAVGGLAGALGALLYAWSLLELLRAWWPGTLDRSFLHLHVTPGSFVIGYAAALAVSVLTILWAVRVLGNVSPRALLSGETTDSAQPGLAGQPRWSLWIAGIAGVTALALVGCSGYVEDHEMKAMTFFGSGALLLTAFLAGIWAWMRGSRQGRAVARGMGALTRLGIRNAARHPVRSLLTVGLLASAVFLVIAVESFHRGGVQDALDPRSGTGGFALLGESSLPIYGDLNTDEGRDKQGFQDTDKTTLQNVRFYAFRLRGGDDASCLNLYNPRRPKLLGAPAAFIALERFRFQDSEARADEERQNPWKLLDADRGPAIPVIADATTAQYVLHKNLGDTLDMPNERGEPVPLRIVGLLADSIFQSQLVLSEANFLKLYPNHEGYHFFLIEAPRDQAPNVQKLLEKTLAGRGFEAAVPARRLESYWAVENTYLATFQALGGLGLLLGALGLAVVLLRTVWERRGELALLRALGFRRSALGWLVFSENSFLLGLGLGVGTLSALLSVLPHVEAGSGQVPWLRLLGLVGLVLVVGLAAGAAAVRTSLRAPLVPALRRD
jgi:ABC-type antimicrobial peptide transport system permease subunit